MREKKIAKLTDSINNLQNNLNNLETAAMNQEQLMDRRAIKSEIERLGKERFKLEHWFFEKEDRFERILLHKDKRGWSNYLFGTRRFLIILLGGKHDLQKAKLSAVRRASVLKKSLAERQLLSPWALLKPRQRFAKLSLWDVMKEFLSAIVPLLDQIL